MEKNKGYININDLINMPIFISYNRFETFGKICAWLWDQKDTAIIKLIENKRLVFSFNYGDNKYFFKYDNATSPYTELVIEKLCKMLNIPCINYELAKVGFIKGVLSKNFKKENARYISGKDLALEYIKNNNLNIDFNNLNNLKSIEVMLKDRYQDDYIVNCIMSELKKLFVLDIIIGNHDRLGQNFMIEESKNIKLANVFDNSRALMLQPKDTFLSLTYDSNEKNSLEDNISSIINSDDEELKEFFINSIEAINEENILNILSKVEEKIGSKMPIIMKEWYQYRFKMYYNYINSCLENVRNRGTR